VALYFRGLQRLELAESSGEQDYSPVCSHLPLFHAAPYFGILLRNQIHGSDMAIFDTSPDDTKAAFNASLQHFAAGLSLWLESFTPVIQAGK
jgi:hypothetical protein